MHKDIGKGNFSQAPKSVSRACHDHKTGRLSLQEASTTLPRCKASSSAGQAKVSGELIVVNPFFVRNAMSA